MLRVHYLSFTSSRLNYDPFVDCPIRNGSFANACLGKSRTGTRSQSGTSAKVSESQTLK